MFSLPCHFGNFMNGDMQELMQYIGENHSAQMAAIASLAKEFAEHKGKTEERLNTLEQADTRQWIVSVCIVPIITVLHYFANKLGFRV